MNRIKINFCRSVMARFALCVCALVLGARALAGRTVYVSKNGLHQNNYSNWVDAATNIQAAIDAAGAGDQVLVSNGVYAANGTGTNTIDAAGFGTNVIWINKEIWLRGISTNPADVVVNGNYPTFTNRCLYVAHALAKVSELKITNGYAYNGAGIFVLNGGIISNCVVASNTAIYNGGGVYVAAAATGLTQIIASSILSNYCGNYGGGIYFASATLIANCLVAGNLAAKRAGGMVFNHTNSLVVNCTISRNNAVDYAGGIYFINTSPTSLLNCVVSANSCPSSIGGGIWIQGGNAGDDAARNCLVVGNVAGNGAGINLQCAANIVSCTIASNRATGGSNIGGLAKNGAGLIINCVIASNYYGSTYTNRADLYLYSDPYTNDFYNCCVGVNPEKLLNLANGSMITNPQFENFSSGNYRPKVTSPCINAGTNQAWMGNAADLDGHRRIDGFFGRTDIGCYEYRWQGSLFKCR